MDTNISPVSVLAIGAHPDDVELGCSGTIIKMVESGLSVGILDLTAGEMGTRGDKETRIKESLNAAEILSVSFRANLFLPDTELSTTPENEKKIVDILRQARPTVILAPPVTDTHPDHKAAGELMESASYKAGFGKYDSSFKPHRPSRVISYMLGQDFQPTFVVDITNYYDKRVESILAYESQFFNENSEKYSGKTKISSPFFLEKLETRIKFYGNRILKRYGEPFQMKEIAEIENPGLLTDCNSLTK